MNRESGGHARPREARLKPEAAHLYPGITAGIWLQAASMVDKVWALRLRRGEGAEYLGERALNPSHFEFRNPGGTEPGRSHGRRATDRRDVEA